MTVPVALVLLAAALLLGAPRAGVRRLAPPAPASDGPVAPVLRPAWVAVGAAAAGGAGGLLGGPTAAALLGGAALALGLLARTRLARPALRPTDGAALAAAWELLDVCLRAGMPVAAALAAAAATPDGSAGAALRRVAGLLQLGADAPDAWAAARGAPGLAAVARAAARSAGTGAALARVAAAEGARVRAELVDTAQARAQRAGVLVAGPLGLCFLPAFLVLGIAPVVIGLAGEALARW
jgi:pilus assembly protein TadC